MDKKTILVVDDTPDNITMISELLKTKYLVKAAPRGAIALKIATSLPDLILLDILMPEMDGFEVLEKLRQDAVTATIPVVFLSSSGTVEEKERGLKLGAKDFLTKPIDSELLFSVIDQYISK